MVASTTEAGRGGGEDIGDVVEGIVVLGDGLQEGLVSVEDRAKEG